MPNIQLVIKLFSKSHRSHSGANEVYFDPIKLMIESESYRKIISIQRDMRVDLMPATERERWEGYAEHSTRYKIVFQEP